MPMQIIRNDITNVMADIIVNTANPEPIYTIGIDRAIYEAAGPELLLEERKKIGVIASGDIAVTPAFALQAKYIIHAVGPRWFGGENGERELLRACYRKALEKAVDLNCESIAFPLIASGANRFPKSEALQIALEEINRFLIKNELMVLLVVFDPRSFELSSKVFQEIHAYVDQHYVDDQRQKEYPDKDEAAFKRMDEGVISTNHMSGLQSAPSIVSSGVIGKLSKEKIMLSKKETFQQFLFRVMREKNLDPRDIYKPANLDRRMFSKILNDVNSKPKKHTVIAIAMALHFDLKQTINLLALAEYALTPNNDFDIIIQWCIENQHYNIIADVNPILFEYGLEGLGSTVRE